MTRGGCDVTIYRNYPFDTARYPFELASGCPLVSTPGQQPHPQTLKTHGFWVSVVTGGFLVCLFMSCFVTWPYLALPYDRRLLSIHRRTAGNKSGLSSTSSDWADLSMDHFTFSILMKLCSHGKLWREALEILKASSLDSVGG